MVNKPFILLAGLLCGCAHNQMTLVNNTPYRLNVTIDSHLVYTNLLPGVAVPVPDSAWVPRTAVAVTGYDAAGHYAGANDSIFYNGQAQVWRVDYLHYESRSGH